MGVVRHTHQSCRSDMAVHVFRATLSSRVAFSSLRGLLRTPASSYTTESATEEINETAELPVVGNGSFSGLSLRKFSKEITDKLLAPVNEEDIEIKPDGLVYLPEIMYRRILNQSFGPGGWGLMPRGEIIYQGESDGAQMVAREYALYCEGRFVSQSLGEHTFFGKSNQQYGNACESAKSSALRRCCKDLGISSELWDPKFVSRWKDKYAVEVWCQNQRTKEKKKFWVKKNSKQQFSYPWVAAS